MTVLFSTMMMKTAWLRLLISFSLVAPVALWAAPLSINPYTCHMGSLCQCLLRHCVNSCSDTVSMAAHTLCQWLLRHCVNGCSDTGSMAAQALCQCQAVSVAAQRSAQHASCVSFRLYNGISTLFNPTRYVLLEADDRGSHPVFDNKAVSSCIDGCCCDWLPCTARHDIVAAVVHFALTWHDCSDCKPKQTVAT